MGFLTDIFDAYKSSPEDKRDIIYNRFVKVLWKSKCRYSKQDKHIRFVISKDIDSKELVDIFSNYTDIKYKVFKSNYSKNLSSIDYIKIRINNLYAYLFDMDVYYNKEYYTQLFIPRNLYYNALKGDCDVENINNVINMSIAKAEFLKQESINNKYDLSWIEYKKLINKCIKKIMDNYITIKEYSDKKEWEVRCTSSSWDEDNYIIGYINKSITMYLYNYIKELDGFNQKYKWKHSLKRYISLDDANNYNALQLCVSKYIDDVDVLNSIDYNKELTSNQVLFLDKIEELLKTKSLKEIILFNKNGTPKINESFVAKELGISRVAVGKTILRISKTYNIIHGME